MKCLMAFHSNCIDAVNVINASSHRRNRLREFLLMLPQTSCGIERENMKFVIQRVRHASVTIEGQITGQIEKGFLVFIGVTDTDTKEIADKMIDKLLKLRIFEDENGKTNLDIQKVNGSLLLVSQFTLYADCRKGNRPSFVKAGAPDHARDLYEYIVGVCIDQISNVQTGEFGADMKVELLNDGPFTIILDSEEIVHP